MTKKQKTVRRHAATHSRRTQKPTRAAVLMLHAMQDHVHLSSAAVSSKRLAAEFQLTQTEMQITRLRAELTDATAAKRDLTLYIEGLTSVLSARAI